MLGVLCGMSPKLPTTSAALCLRQFGKGGVLAHGEDLLKGQVFGHREAGHYYLIQLVGRFDVENADHPPLDGDL